MNRDAQDPAWEALRAQMHRGVDAIVDRMLAGDLDGTLASVRAMEGALTFALEVIRIRTLVLRERVLARLPGRN